MHDAPSIHLPSHSSSGCKIDLSFERCFQVFLSKFEFISELIDTQEFANDTKLYIKECKKYYEYKRAQAPIIAANKEFEKKKRKFLQEVKMSKDAPTKKQLYYYEKLCKRYNIESIDVATASRLDMKREIERILDEHSGN